MIVARHLPPLIFVVVHMIIASLVPLHHSSPVNYYFYFCFCFCLSYPPVLHHLFSSRHFSFLCTGGGTLEAATPGCGRRQCQWWHWDRLIVVFLSFCLTFLLGLFSIFTAMLEASMYAHCTGAIFGMEATDMLHLYTIVGMSQAYVNCCFSFVASLFLLFFYFGKGSIVGSIFCAGGVHCCFSRGGRVATHVFFFCQFSLAKETKEDTLATAAWCYKVSPKHMLIVVFLFCLTFSGLSSILAKAAMGA